MFHTKPHLNGKDWKGEVSLENVKVKENVKGKLWEQTLELH